MTCHKTCSPLLNIESVLPILSRIAIFGGLDDKQLFKIFRLLEKVSYRAGEHIFSRGDEPTHIYVVLRGTVKIVVESRSAPFEMMEMGVGQCFGETAVIAIQPHSASAIAVEDTELIVLPRQALLSIYDTDAELFGRLILNIAREVCRRLMNTDDVILHYFGRE